MEPVFVYYRGTYREGVFNELQTFINHAPDLALGESFYFGMWILNIEKTEGEARLREYDFMSRSYISYLERSLMLWEAQEAVCASQELSWNLIRIDQHVFYTPNAFNYPIDSVIEGVRDEPVGEDSSGWFIYSDSDRENGEAFINAPLGDLLGDFKIHILRFLGLPTGWLFNVDASGDSHVFQEPYGATSEQ